MNQEVLIEVFAELRAWGTVVIALLSLAISIVTIRHTLRVYKKSIQENRMLRAPFLTLSKYNCQKPIYKFTASSHSFIKGSFLFDRRLLEIDANLGNGTSDLPITDYSLAIDTSFDQNASMKDIEQIIGFGITTLCNTGYDMQALEIKAIDVYTNPSGYQANENPTYNVEPSMHDSIFLSLQNKESINIYISWRTQLKDKSSNLFDVCELLKDDYWDNKIFHADGNLLNTHFPGMADLWTDIVFHCVTTNRHNERFEQKVHLFIRDKVYYSESVLWYGGILL